MGFGHSSTERGQNKKQYSHNGRAMEKISEASVSVEKFIQALEQKKSAARIRGDVLREGILNATIYLVKENLEMIGKDEPDLLTVYRVAGELQSALKKSRNDKLTSIGSSF